MTPAELQDRLRASLEARAADVTPDPATWRRVERRIQRGVALRWAGVATATAAVVVLAAIVAPALLRDRARVELDRAPVVQQPDPEPTPSAVPLPPVPSEQPTAEPAASLLPPYGGYVWTDGASISTTDAHSGATTLLARGDPAVGTEITDLAVLPGSTVADVTVVYRLLPGGEPCGDLSWGRYVGGQPVDGGEVLPSDQLGCAHSPVFSPDGRDLGWLEDDGPGTWTLRTIGWDIPGPVGSRNAAWDLDLVAEDALIVEWVWYDRADATAAGTVAVATRRDGEAGDVVDVPIERQADGALALVGAIEPYGMPDGPQVVGLAHGRPADGAAGPAYVLERTAEGSLDLVAQDPAETVMTGPPFEVDDPSVVWMEALGDVLLIGDRTTGAGSSMDFSGDGLVVEALAGEVRHAVPVVASMDVDRAPTELATSPPAARDPGVSPDPYPCEQGPPPPGSACAPSAAAPDDASSGAPTPVPPSPSPEPTGSPGPQPSAGSGEATMPPAVAQTRDELLAATESNDWERLRALLPADGEFTSNYGGESDHIAFWQQEEANGIDVRGTLASLLREEGAVTEGGYWVWPAEFATAAEYYDYRVGIDQDGVWRFLVAGD